MNTVLVFKTVTFSNALTISTNSKLYVACDDISDCRNYANYFQQVYLFELHFSSSKKSMQLEDSLLVSTCYGKRLKETELNNRYFRFYVVSLNVHIRIFFSRSVNLTNVAVLIECFYLCLEIQTRDGRGETVE